MPRPLSATAILEKNELSSDQAFVVLIEVQVPSTPLTRFRLAANPTAVSWQGNTYSPAALGLSVLREDGEGGFGELEVTLGNARRDAMPYLEQYDLSGQPARLILVSQAELTSGEAVIDDPYRVISVAASAEAIVLRLGQWNAYQSQFPGAVAAREHCRFQYRGARCAYTGALATCDKTRQGPNGCEAHAVDSDDHPRRFGGFPLMPRGGGVL